MIPGNEDDAADFDERDIAEKGTDSTGDTQFHADKLCVPRLFLNRATMHGPRELAARRRTFGPTTVQTKRVGMNSGDNTENSAPTAGVSRTDKARGGFAESGDDSSFQTALETLCRPAQTKREGKVEEEGVFVTAVGEDGGNVNEEEKLAGAAGRGFMFQLLKAKKQAK